jgi:uncharacterized membrane protein YfcA
MDPEFIGVNLAVLAAAALQSATGIGFGIIAGPILLVALNDGSAIQVSILLNLIIAGLLTPMLWRDVDRLLLRRLVAGLLIGSPFGVWLFLVMNIAWLKSVAAVAVVMMLILTARNHRRRVPPEPVATGNAEQGSMGLIAGLMGGSLGIPGPVPAAWMSARGYGKDAVRATILAMFVFSYLVALLLQLLMADIRPETFRLALTLSPATVAGIIAGRWLGTHLTEEIFRTILLVVLAATVILLLISLA